MEQDKTNAEHVRWQERLDQSVDGTLPAADRAALESHLSSCTGCRRERQSLERLRDQLASTRVEVRAELVSAVMAAVNGERRAVARPLPFAAALVGLLVVLSVVVLRVAGAEVQGLELIGTVLDFATSTLVAGAGLLAASWRGVGMVVEEWLLASMPNLLVSLMVLVALNALAIRLVRSRRRAASRARRDDRRS